MLFIYVETFGSVIIFHSLQQNMQLLGCTNDICLFHSGYDYNTHTHTHTMFYQHFFPLL